MHSPPTFAWDGGGAGWHSVGFLWRHHHGQGLEWDSRSLEGITPEEAQVIKMTVLVRFWQHYCIPSQGLWLVIVFTVTFYEVPINEFNIYYLLFSAVSTLEWSGGRWDYSNEIILHLITKTVTYLNVILILLLNISMWILATKVKFKAVSTEAFCQPLKGGFSVNRPIALLFHVSECCG